MARIPLSKPCFDSDELDEVKDVLESGWVSQGPKVKEFEGVIAEYLHVRHAIAVSNCTAALHLSLIGIGASVGDEVIVADYTFPATGHAVLYCGAKPIFADIHSRTYNIAVTNIEEHITDRTKAIIPVHTFGQPANMDPILEIADQYGLIVIEDAACALGATYKGRFAGTLGEIGCFSFHARKGITTGEGGMVVTNNDALAERIRFLSVFGMKSAWDREQSDSFIVPEFTEAGYNYKMSDITAAVGVAQLRKIEDFIAKRQKLAHYWDEKLTEIDKIDPPFVDSNVRHVYQSYVALLEKGVNRNRLIKKLQQRDIQAQIGTYASHIQPVYQPSCSCPNSLDVYQRAIALPMYVSLNEEDIDTVCTALSQIIGAYQAGTEFPVLS